MAHSCDDYFILCICTVGESVELSHVLDAFHIPLCLNSHFLQKNWTHLAYKCASGETKWRVGFARWKFTTANLKDAGKSFEREGSKQLKMDKNTSWKQTREVENKNN